MGPKNWVWCIRGRAIVDQWIELTSEPAHFLLVRLEHDRRFCLTLVQIRHYRRASQSVDLVASPVSTSPQILEHTDAPSGRVSRKAIDRRELRDIHIYRCIINLVLHIYQLHNQCFGKRMIFPRELLELTYFHLQCLQQPARILKPNAFLGFRRGHPCK